MTCQHCSSEVINIYEPKERKLLKKILVFHSLHQPDQVILERHVAIFIAIKIQAAIIGFERAGGELKIKSFSLEVPSAYAGHFIRIQLFQNFPVFPQDVIHPAHKTVCFLGTSVIPGIPALIAAEFFV